MTYRTLNGHVDDGSALRSNKNTHLLCPNCGSNAYRETVSMESCSACGLRCDYWGGGANAVYEEMMASNHRAAERREQEREDAERDGWGYRSTYYD